MALSFSKKVISIIKRSNQYQKLDKAPFIIYPDLEWVTEKINECKNNPEDP